MKKILLFFAMIPLLYLISCSGASKTTPEKTRFCELDQCCTNVCYDKTDSAYEWKFTDFGSNGSFEKVERSDKRKLRMGDLTIIVSDTNRYAAEIDNGVTVKDERLIVPVPSMRIIIGDTVKYIRRSDSLYASYNTRYLKLREESQ